MHTFSEAAPQPSTVLSLAPETNEFTAGIRQVKTDKTGRDRLLAIEASL